HEIETNVGRERAGHWPAGGQRAVDRAPVAPRVAAAARFVRCVGPEGLRHAGAGDRFANAQWPGPRAEGGRHRPGLETERELEVDGPVEVDAGGDAVAVEVELQGGGRGRPRRGGE